MKIIRLAGKIVSGRGEGQKFLKLNWVRNQVSDRLNFTPFPGTLNLRLDEESTKQRHLLTRNLALGICTSKGYCTGLLFKATISEISCGVILPLVKGYPDNELEIVAEMDLRKKLSLHNGDHAQVSVFI